MSETEPDRLEGAPHPRETMRLIGHGAQEEAVVAAISAGKLHHAWLFAGPEGVGKATFAYRVARRLMAGLKPDNHLDSLDVAPDHPAARQILSQSHPDLTVIRRGFQKDGKTLSRTIAVDIVRRGLEVFDATAAAGGWRICIVDSVDEMNTNAANALLKMLEEPPRRSLFMLVSHRPGRLLPTIRSRCRRLDFAPLSSQEVEAAMKLAGAAQSAADDDIARAAALSGGSVLAAFRRLDPEVLSLVEQVRAQLAILPGIDLKALVALAEAVNGKAGDEAIALTLDTVEHWIGGAIHAGARHGAGHVRPLLDAWESGRRAIDDAMIFNLDRRPAFLGLFQDLAQATRRRAG
jgi:DNA polymerase-3 subunit delta'